jgi:hypothetical protein
VYDALSAINEGRAEKKENAKDQAVRAYEELLEWGEDGEVLIQDIAARIGKNDRTVKNYFREMPDQFLVSSGGSGKGTKSTVKRLV